MGGGGGWETSPHPVGDPCASSSPGSRSSGPPPSSPAGGACGVFAAPCGVCGGGAGGGGGCAGGGGAAALGATAWLTGAREGTRGGQGPRPLGGGGASALTHPPPPPSPGPPSPLTFCAEDFGPVPLAGAVALDGGYVALGEALLALVAQAGVDAVLLLLLPHDEGVRHLRWGPTQHWGGHTQTLVTSPPPPVTRRG